MDLFLLSQPSDCAKHPISHKGGQKMSWFTYIAVTIFFFALLVLIAYIAYLKWIIRTSFTRERFAFQALWINTAASMFALAAFVGPEPPWAAVANIASALLGLSYRVEASPSPINALFAFLLLAFLLYWTQQIFRHWNGPVSARQNEQTAKNEPTSLIREGLWEAQRLVRRQPASTIADRSPEHRFQSIIAGIEPSPWHERARELVSLKRTYLSFDSDYDWHQEYNVWIGENRHTNDVVGLVCLDSAPNEDTLTQTAAYVRRIADGRAISLLIACRQNSSTTPYLGGVDINHVTERELLNNLVNFNEYFRVIDSRVNKKSLPDSTLTLQNVYTPSRLLSEKNSIVNENASACIEEWLNEPGERQLVIYGGYGQGKSTTTLMATHGIIQKIKAGGSHRVPILIELRGKSPSTLGVHDILSAWAYPYRIDPRAMMRLLEAGRLAIFFDGFDEMADAGTAEARFSHFASLWRFNLPGTKLLFTGRPQFLTEQEKSAVFGNGRNLAAGAYCQTLALAPFDDSRISDSLRGFPEAVRNAIVVKARNDQRFYDIVSRASLLYVVAHLWDKPELSDLWDSITSGSAISLFIQHSYRRQSEKLRGAQNFMPLGENERAYFMQGIAVYMAVKTMPNQISNEEFLSISKKLYETMPINMKPQYSAYVSGPSDRPLKERMKDEINVIEKICTDIRSFGILENDTARIGALRFAHKSFYEVLFSSYLHNLITRNNNDGFHSIASATNAKLQTSKSIDGSGRYCAELLYSSIQSDDFEEIFDVIFSSTKLRRFFYIFTKKLSINKFIFLPVYKLSLTSALMAISIAFQVFNILGVSVAMWKRLYVFLLLELNYIDYYEYMEIFSIFPIFLFSAYTTLILIKSINSELRSPFTIRCIIFLEYCICSQAPNHKVKQFIDSDFFRRSAFNDFNDPKYENRYEHFLPNHRK
jgi:hypothetical protein